METESYEHVIGTVGRIYTRDRARNYLVFCLKQENRKIVVAGATESPLDTGLRIECVGYFKTHKKPEYRYPLFHPVFIRIIPAPDWSRLAVYRPGEIGDSSLSLWSLLCLVEECGGTIDLVEKLFKAFGEQAMARLRENPYRLMEFGADFALADQFGRLLGIPPITKNRLRAGGCAFLEQQKDPLPEKEWITAASQFLDIPAFFMESWMEEAKNSGEICLRQGLVSLGVTMQKEDTPLSGDLPLFATNHPPVSTVDSVSLISPHQSKSVEDGNFLFDKLCVLRDAPSSVFLMGELESEVRKLVNSAITLYDRRCKIPLKVLFMCGVNPLLSRVARGLADTMRSCGARVGVCGPDATALRRVGIGAANTRIVLASPRSAKIMARSNLVLVAESDRLNLEQWDMLMDSVAEDTIILILGNGCYHSCLTQLRDSLMFAVLQFPDGKMAQMVKEA